MATLNGKKFLDQHGLNYVWQKIDNKYAHVVDATTGATAGATIDEGNVVIGASGRGIKDSGYSIGDVIDDTTRVVSDFGTTGTTLATEANVKKYVSDAVGSLGDAIELKGLVDKTAYPYFPWDADEKTPTRKQLTTITLTSGTELKNPANGDLVIYDGEEWVWVKNGKNDPGAWHEIGIVKDDEAIKSVGGTGVIAVTEPTTGNLTVSLNAIGQAEVTGGTVSEVYFDVKKVGDTDKLTGTVYMGDAQTPTEGHKLAGVSGNTLYTTDIDLSTVLTTDNVLSSTDIDNIIDSAESLLVVNNDTPVWAGGEVEGVGYDPYTKYPKA